MRLRIQYPPKGNPCLEISDDSSFSQLVKEISNLTCILEEEILLKKGFPPSLIVAKQDAFIKEILVSGETILVQKKEHVGFQAHTSRPVPKYIRTGNTSSSTKSSLQTLNSTSSSSFSKKVISSKRKIKKNSSEDWAESLVTVFSENSKNLNTAKKALKGVFKNAVQRRYRSTQAEKRWASVQGSCYTIQLLPPFRFIVTYPSGPRSKSEEQYIALPKELIKPVLEEAYTSGEGSRMNLRPYYLAEAQPLIFWNMVRLFNGNIKQGYFETLPNFDWTFIDDRHRELSDKAKENLRQKQEADQIKKNGVSVKKVRLEKKTSIIEKKK